MSLVNMVVANKPRYGSRRWASELKGDWVAKRVSWGDGNTGFEVFVGDFNLAVVPDDLRGTCPDSVQQAYSLLYGGSLISNALYGDICEALGQIEDLDDENPVQLLVKG